MDTTSGDYELYATAKDAAAAYFEASGGEDGEGPDVPGPDDLERFLEDHGYEQTGYKVRWEFVSAHLTMAAARQYIAENGHRCHDRCTLELGGTKREMRVYVESAYRCPEMIAVVEALKAGELVLMENVTAALSEIERLRLIAVHPEAAVISQFFKAAIEVVGEDLLKAQARAVVAALGTRPPAKVAPVVSVSVGERDGAEATPAAGCPEGAQPSEDRTLRAVRERIKAGVQVFEIGVRRTDDDGEGKEGGEP